MKRDTLLDLTKSIKDIMIELYKEQGGILEVKTGQDGKKYVEAGFVNMILDELDACREFAKKCYALKEWDEFEEKVLDKRNGMA